MAPEDTGEQQRYATAEQIVRLFRPERIIYLSLSVVSALLVLYLGCETILQPGDKMTASGFLFGSTGLITFNIGRLLKMFDKVFDAVLLR
jgi:hypothetical protein